MLFQRPNPFLMSIADNVVAGVRAYERVPRGQLRDIAEQRLRAVGLWEAVSGRLKDSPLRLSGGQQQLLCLARALAVSPGVLLLDEPTSSLDPVATESIEELIRGLAPELTVVIVTHNLAQARRVSHRTVFLNRGRLVEHGDTNQMGLLRRADPVVDRPVLRRCAAAVRDRRAPHSDRQGGHRDLPAQRGVTMRGARDDRPQSCSPTGSRPPW